MKHLPFSFLMLISLLFVGSLVACDTEFQNNPHGLSYIYQLTPLTTAPVVPTAKATPIPSLAPFGFGASLQAITTQYGPPTRYSAPPLYAFQDGSNPWPKGSLIIVTMK